MALQTCGSGGFPFDVSFPSSRARCSVNVLSRFGSSPSSCSRSSQLFTYLYGNYGSSNFTQLWVCGARVGFSRFCYGRDEYSHSDCVVDDDKDYDGKNSSLSFQSSGNPSTSSSLFGEANPFDDSGVISACIIGVLTGISIVIFNNAVHEIHNFFWDNIAHQGVSWLREETIESKWKQILVIPVSGGVIVSMLKILQDVLEARLTGISLHNVKATLRQFLKAAAACFTLGTGNSLGPEGPSVDIGASIGKGVSVLMNRSAEEKLSFVAAGSAAGISAGFNAAFAGCFFAVESLLWPSPAASSKSLTNTTSMVILSAVTASVLSEIGLGSEPTFKVPEYDFRSPSELPLYLLLGSLCGLVSLTLSNCTLYILEIVHNVQKLTGIPRALFPVMGGLIVGLVALEYPEILYWGFENVDVLLGSQPFAKENSVNLLLQLVVVKIVVTSVCRASGLVGGFYAPSLFIGAATGMAYGKICNFVISHFYINFHLSFLEVASPQAYGLVGMAATLAGVCGVPLTAVLLLFELTQDYRIVLPLLGAVGLSSWIASTQFKEIKALFSSKLKLANTHMTQRDELCISNSIGMPSSYSLPPNASNPTDRYEAKSSFYSNDSNITAEFEKKILVSQAMRTRYVTVLMNTLLTESVSLMLSEKQSCAMVVDNENILIGVITLVGIQEFVESTKIGCQRSEGFVVSDICSVDHKYCKVSGVATPNMSLFSAQMIMAMHATSQVPVVSDLAKDSNGFLIGLLDKKCISLACSVMATKEFLTRVSITQHRSPE